MATICSSRKSNSQRPSSRARSEWIRCSNTAAQRERTSNKMKKTTINKIVGTILLAGVCEIGLGGIPAITDLTRASDNPKVIEITAKKFEFTPSEITLKKGEPVILRLTSSDRVHGFMSKP